MDTQTVLDIIERVEIALACTKADKDFNENFACGTKEEYKAYLMGQYDTLQATLGHFQSFIEGQLNAAENSTPE
jgi:hypothetical protein